MGVNAAPVRNVPPSEFETGQVSVGSSPTLIIAERKDRRGVLIINGSAVALFLGNSTVTVNSGLRILDVIGTGIVVPSSKAIYGIVAGGSADVSYMELY